MNCETCQPLLLDHLYGLLDGPEAAGVDAHLASCPACTAARAETARVQGLIARAAKSAFPNTRFEAPAAPPQPVKSAARTAAPAALPFPAPGSKKPGRAFRIGTVLPWAVAATVLLAIPGTVLPVFSIFNSAAEADRAAESARRESELRASNVALARAGSAHSLSDAEFRLATAEQAHNLLLKQWDDSLKANVAAATRRPLTVEVKKPANFQPGAPNDFEVVVNDERKQWERSGKRMIAEVHAVNASDAVIFTQALDSERAGDKRHALRLPTSSWTKVAPDAELFLVVAQVDEKTQTRTELVEGVRLAGPVFATLLVTDKAAYRPGDRLFFRSLTLDRVTFRPPGREQVLRYELLNSEGRPVPGLSVQGTTDLVRVGAGANVDPVRTADGQPVRGVGCGEFVLPADLADGDYTLVLREHAHPGGFPATVPAPVRRTVKVRSGSADQYRKQLEFKRASFAPGETVEAWAELAFQDRALPNVPVAVAAEVDGRVIEHIEAERATGANGRANFRFVLPDEILNGDVRLKVTFRTPGKEESVARQVPVVGNRLRVEFFPECGDVLVAGVECKVYVRATTPAGVPVDVRGTITDGRQVLARVEALTDKDEPGANRGLASFTYTPELGTRVWLKLEAPAGSYAPILPEVPVSNATVALLGGASAVASRTGYPLPLPKPDGVVASVIDPVTAPGEPIRVRLHSVGQPRTLFVGAYTRGKLSDMQKVAVDPELPQTVKLMAGADPRGGVVRVTVFEEVDARDKEGATELKPVAERLVFRKPGEVLKLAVDAVPASAPGAVVPVAPVAISAPGTPVAMKSALPANSAARLLLSATDEKGNPVAAILWAAAVNTGAAPGPRDRLLPTHFLLAGEVKKPDDLEYADFLLTDHPKAAEALDLLLGTQGWRRFAEQQVAPDGRARPGAVPNSELARLHRHNGQYTVEIESGPIRDNRKVNEMYAPLYEKAVQAVARAKTAVETARASAVNSLPEGAARAAADSAKQLAEEKAVRAESAREPVRLFRAGVWYGVAGFVALGLCCAAFAVARPTGRFPLGFSTLGSIGLAAFLILASGWDEAKGAAPDAAPLSARAPESSQADLDWLVGDRKPSAPERTTSALPERSKADAVGVLGGWNAKNAKVPAPTFGGPGGAAPGAGSTTPAALPGPPKLVGGGPGIATGLGPMPEPKIAPEPKVSPVPSPPSPAPSPPTGPEPLLPGTGWDGHKKNGVPFSDIVRNQGFQAFGVAGRASRTAEQANELKKAADCAVAYANDRANILAKSMEPYFDNRQQTPQPKPKGPVEGAGGGFGKLQNVEQYVFQQIRGAVAPVPPLVVREYAEPRPTAAYVEDAPDTVLWQPVIVLPADGKAALNFQLGSAPGGYQVVVAGHTADGRLGATRGVILTAPARTPLPQIAPDVPGGTIPPAVLIAPTAPVKPPAP